MKKIFTILIFTSLFAGELEVDGDLTVTGNIQNQTIDSLLQVIQDLQSQLSALQGGNRLETRVFELPRIEFTNGYQSDIDISAITGYELDYGIFKIVHVNDFYVDGEHQSISYYSSFINHLGNPQTNEHGVQIYNTGDVNYIGGGQTSLVFHNGQDNFMIIGGSGASGWVDLVLSVTSQFPSDFDVQQRKPGLQSKDKKTEKQ